VRVCLGVVLLAALACGWGAQPAQARLIVGMGDQKPAMFEDENFLDLGLYQARLLVPYDRMLARDFARTDAWLHAARHAGITPLVAFNRGAKVSRLPTVAKYEQAVRILRARYPWVTRLSVWNEANHWGQPTHRRPKRAAEYFNAMREVCPHCKIVAADVLDQPGVLRWIARFQQTAIRPRIWGLHNYVDVNRGTAPPASSSTNSFANFVRGEVWITESGGLVRFGRDFRGGREAEARAATAITRAFALARSNPRIKRLYVYHWSAGDVFHNWDSAFVDKSGRPRPAFKVLRRELRSR